VPAPRSKTVDGTKKVPPILRPYYGPWCAGKNKFCVLSTSSNSPPTVAVVPSVQALPVGVTTKEWPRRAEGLILRAEGRACRSGVVCSGRPAFHIWWTITAPMKWKCPVEPFEVKVCHFGFPPRDIYSASQTQTEHRGPQSGKGKPHTTKQSDVCLLSYHEHQGAGKTLEHVKYLHKHRLSHKSFPVAAPKVVCVYMDHEPSSQ